VAPFPIAIFWQTPYFCEKLAVLSLLARPSPASESDLLDEVELFLANFGPLASRSFRLNLWPPSLLSEWIEEGFRFTGVGGEKSFPLLPLRSRPPVFSVDCGITSLPTEFSADMLGARVASWLGGLLGPRLGGALSIGEVATGKGKCR